MADFPPPRTTIDAVSPPTTAVLAVYVLLGLAALMQFGSSGLATPAPLLTFIGIIAVIVAYVKRDEARGTWLESHVNWTIGTFWWSTLWAVIGWLVLILLAIVLIGFALGPLIWAVVAIWVLYRVIRGMLYFKDRQPIPGH
jgi:uncharacterized membrane protein